MSTPHSEVTASANSPQRVEVFELKPTFSKGPTSSSGIEISNTLTTFGTIDTPSTAVPERTAKHRRTEYIHLSTLYWNLLLAGWNDASTGPLLPRIQKVYHIGFTVVSILFVAACCVR